MDVRKAQVQWKNTVIQCGFQVSGPIKFYPAQVLSSVVPCCQTSSNAFNCFQKMSGVVKRYQVGQSTTKCCRVLTSKGQPAKNDGS